MHIPAALHGKAAISYASDTGVSLVCRIARKLGVYRDTRWISEVGASLLSEMWWAHPVTVGWKETLVTYRRFSSTSDVHALALGDGTMRSPFCCSQGESALVPISAGILQRSYCNKCRTLPSDRSWRLIA